MSGPCPRSIGRTALARVATWMRASHVGACWGVLPLLAFGACLQERPARSSPDLAPAAAVATAERSPPSPSSEEPAPPRPDSSETPLAGTAGAEQLRTRYGDAPPLRIFKGEASYYADSLRGRRTASGEVYEPRAFTAAHRSLPFGTVLRVSRADGRHTVYVRVTDRGPFGRRGRVLDLSRAAAEELDMMRAGVIQVRVEVVHYGPARRRR